jgi:hypothetical protein
MLFSLAQNSFVPLDSMAFIKESQQVEGLAVGNVEGYGVGSLGIVVQPTRRCTKYFTEDLYKKIESQFDDATINRFYDDFENASEVNLRGIDKNLKLIDIWKSFENKDFIAGLTGQTHER